MTFLEHVRKMVRRHPWQALVAVALLQVGAACPEVELPTGGGNTPTVTAPSNLTATAASATQINLGWTDNSSNEDGFRVERAPGGTTTFAEIATVAAGVTTYQNIGLTGATQYAYRVRAYNATTTSEYSATATTTTLLAAPTAPSNLLASGVSSTQVNLVWTDNSTNEDGFKIERSTTGTTGLVEVATVGAGPPPSRIPVSRPLPRTPIASGPTTRPAIQRTPTPRWVSHPPFRSRRPRRRRD